MTEISRPWNGTTVGDAGPYSDTQWQELYRYIIGLGGVRANTGVFLGSGSHPNDGLKVIQQGPAAAGVDVLPGSALVQGIAYFSDSAASLSVAVNASGNPRVDTVIIRADYALQECRLAILTGTPGATPVPPSLTQTPGVMWEIPVADIAAANGFSTIVQANITPRQEWINASPGVYLDHVLNNSGIALEDGDVVVWDNTAFQAVTTTTTLSDPLAAGIVRGRIEDGTYGRIQTEGLGYIRANSAVTVGDRLGSSTTTRQAGITKSPSLLGNVLETTSGAGLVLANIHVSNRYMAYAILQHIEAQNVAGGATVANTWTTRPLNTETVDANGIVAIATNQFTPIAGIYRLRAQCTIFGTTANVRHRLRNITAGSTPAGGVSPLVRLGNAAASTGDISPLEVIFTANGTDAYAIQYYVSVLQATNGLGIAMNAAGETETYMTILLEKIG